jgi:HK97 family phage prohead protease
MNVRVKAYTAINKTNVENRTVESVISTAARDRAGDTIDPAGWDLENYRKSPSVLWAHSYSTPPIGRARSVFRRRDALVAVTEFVPKAVSPFADTIFEMYASHFLHGWSVGFRPLKWEPRADGGIDFIEQELLEYSAVPVPANPEAVSRAKSAGIDLLPIRKWAEELLDRDYGLETLEDVYWSSSTRRSYPSASWRRNPDLLDTFEAMTTWERKSVVRGALRLAVLDGYAKALAARTGRLP